MMSDIFTERRLGAVLAVDMVGYSRQMGMDEPDTLQRFDASWCEEVEPRIDQHHGEIINLTGDGALVMFASVVEAVLCAVEIQQAMVERNAAIPEQERIVFRIGINLADVIVKGKKIVGDGVNVAARLEGLAEPGGICISHTVYDQVRDKLRFQFQDLGERPVKNIARPVRAFAVLLPPKAPGIPETELIVTPPWPDQKSRDPTPNIPEVPSNRKRVWGLAGVMVSMMLLSVSVMLLNIFITQPKDMPISNKEEIRQDPKPPVSQVGKVVDRSIPAIVVDVLTGAFNPQVDRSLPAEVVNAFDGAFKPQVGDR